MANVYVASHWSADRRSSGYTIVAARNPGMAREMVWTYLCSKRGANNQCSSKSLLEIEPLDDSPLFSDLYFSLPMQKSGVLCEYRLDESDPAAAPLMVAYMPGENSQLSFGENGHEKEYLLSVAGHFGDELISTILSKRLQNLLPDFTVDNRGTRIEIYGKVYGHRDDEAVTAAVKAVFGENLNISRLK